MYDNGVYDYSSYIFNRYFYFIYAIKEKMYPFIIVSILAFASGVFLIVICPLNPSSPLNATDNLKDRAIEAYKDGDKIYINGSPVEDGFDLNGVNLDKYDIKLENDTVYKTKRESPRFL